MKKRNLVAVIIVLFICVAVYFNLNSGEIVSDADRMIGDFEETDVKINDKKENDSQDKKNDDLDENNNDYFENARLEKQKARDTAISTLEKSANEESLSQETRDSAAKSIETISTNAVSETRIETLVKAKGFEECVTLINENGVSVIVKSPEGKMRPEDTTKIKDIVCSETEFLPSQIKIIEIN